MALMHDIGPAQRKPPFESRNHDTIIFSKSQIHRARAIPRRADRGTRLFRVARCNERQVRLRSQDAYI